MSISLFSIFKCINRYTKTIIISPFIHISYSLLDPFHVIIVLWSNLGVNNMQDNPSSNSKVTSRKLTDAVIERLKEKIFTGHYKVGDRLPSEPQLMEEFSVGRSTLREAIKVLVHAGVLEVKQGRGTRILSLEQTLFTTSFEHQLHSADTKDIYEARAMLDLEVARLAVYRRTDEDLLAMKSFLKQRKDALQKGNYSSYIEADISFHLSIAKASKNTVLYTLYQSFIPTLKKVLSSFILHQDEYKDNSDIHHSLYKAILDQDENKAMELVKANLVL